MIQTAFVLQRDEFNKAQRLVLRYLPTGIRVAGWIQCGLLVSLMLLGVAYQPEGKLQPISLLIVLLVWLLFVTGGIRARAVMTLQFKRMAEKEICYEFDETGFIGRMPDGETRLGWASVTRFLETNALFVLSSDVLFYTIPKRALSSDDINSLRELLTEKIIPSRL